MQATIRFIRAFPSTKHVIRADPSALGTIPASALRYCEAIRTASSFGWYVFPARSVTLLFDGLDVYMQHDSEWEVLRSEYAADPDGWWYSSCPNSLRDKAPPFISTLGNPGYVQIWSGHFVQTKEQWSTLIRPIANTSISGQFSCFEGIVESDHFSPVPLFINIRLSSTNIPISINSDEPLFQVQPIHRSCYSANVLNNCINDEAADMTPRDWEGYSNTVRSVETTSSQHQTGRYAAQTRKRAKALDVAT